MYNTGPIVSSPGAKALASRGDFPVVPILARFFSLEEGKSASGRAELPEDRLCIESTMSSPAAVEPRLV